ncbi:MAG: sigma 54-interacting transcriptional regulator [Proteobacteria bacterium]|nr:sigma 54-interacting transcriptional regulator [Pseudomonadota bacterium]MBU1708481.1 sigma 54-interacting transcriptional regulator [Pseudomonadota bacterium]
MSKERPKGFEKIITVNSKMLSIFQDILYIAETSKPILITGETGVGKELIVDALHQASKLKGRFVTVNAAGLDDNMFSDTLFGHVKGAYTGADQGRKGLVERAEGGTLVLDEIGDLSLASQIKLLRLLQEKEYMPLGQDKPKKTNVRILAVTNKDLWELQRVGKFRADLNFRLRTHHLHLPPLRERLDDLPVLVDHFLAKAAYALNKEKPTIPQGLISYLETFSFMGNIRELQDLIFDAVSRLEGEQLSIVFFKNYRANTSSSKDVSHGFGSQDQKIFFPTELPTIKQVTSLLVQEAMKRTKGKQTAAAKLLGITQQALSKRLKLEITRNS